MKLSFEQTTWGVLRIFMGWLFFWPFLDKVFGLGFSTESGKAWLDGVSPTYGYLAMATKGPFAPIFQALASSSLVTWLFMLGLLLIGLSLLLGIGVRVAGYTGALLLALMFLAGSLPPLHNPVIDEHIIYLMLLILFTRLPVGNWLGFGKWWSQQPVVKQFPSLR